MDDHRTPTHHDFRHAQPNRPFDSEVRWRGFRLEDQGGKTPLSPRSLAHSLPSHLIPPSVHRHPHIVRHRLLSTSDRISASSDERPRRRSARFATSARPSRTSRSRQTAATTIHHSTPSVTIAWSASSHSILQREQERERERERDRTSRTVWTTNDPPNPSSSSSSVASGGIKPVSEADRLGGDVNVTL